MRRLRLWWHRRRRGYVCEFGMNHYLDGCTAHGCLNRDAVFGPLNYPRPGDKR